MTLLLPQVTLVMAETRARELAKLSLLDTLSKITPAEVIVHTDKQDDFGIDGVTYIHMSDRNRADFNAYVFLSALPAVKTEFVLFQEWDGGVHDVSCWNDEFLQYDYIGAPWTFYPPDDPYSVGNGGFSIRTARLARHVSTSGFPPLAPALELSNDLRYSDHSLCRIHRDKLEKSGFRWAPFDVAGKFAAEDATFTGRSFGFHRFSHWGRVFGRQIYLERCAALARFHAGKFNFGDMRFAPT